MDNRLGSFIALEAARLVAEAGAAPGDVAAVGAVQEEITFGGARTTAFALQPDVAIAVDVTHATDAPGIEVKEQGKHELGGGAVIERGSIIHPMVFEALHDAAERGGHPLHRAGVRGRAPGPTPTRSTSPAPASPPGLVSIAAALHALAGGDGAALGHRRVRAAHRGVRPVAVARDALPTLGPRRASAALASRARSRSR